MILSLPTSIAGSLVHSLDNVTLEDKVCHPISTKKKKKNLWIKVLQ